MPSGIVEFYTYWGKPVEDAIYTNTFHRKRILSTWLRIYGDKFRKGYVHIIPDDYDLLTNKNGTNGGINYGANNK